MKSKRLFAAMGGIDDSYISEDAEAFTVYNKVRKFAYFQNKSIIRYAGFAACAAIVLYCVWAGPRLLNNPNPIIDNPSLISSDNPQPGGQTDAGMNPPAYPDPEAPAPDEVLPLVLNKIGSQLSASIAIDGHFWHELNDEQLNAVFPDLPFSIIATANYRGDGSLYNVVAYEASAGGERAVYNEFYTATMIEVIGAGGGSMGDVIYEYEPITTDIWGVPVIAGVFDFKKNDGVALYIAKFTACDITYNIEIHDDDAGDSGKDKLSLIVNKIIHYQMINGAIDLSILSNPVAPELRDERLSLEKARNDPDFGVYVPAAVPPKFTFASAQRFINQERNSLSVFWDTGLDHINWSVSRATDYDYGLIVAANEPEKYDLSLYPIPRAESIPKELWECVNNPVFLAKELSLDVIKARAYYMDNDRGDTPGWRMDFSVLYGDVVVRVDIKGASPEQVWEMFTEISEGQKNDRR